MLVQSAVASDIVGEIASAAAPVPAAVAPMHARAVDRNHRVRDPRVVRAARRANSGDKRLFDVIASLFGLVLLLPVFVTLAILIKMNDGGPVFYAHRRVGRRGRTFRCWKFRTMQEDADHALAAFLEQNPEAAAEWRETQKLRFDPRITTVGRFLRFTSLDELPQLFNVVLGEMSLVGPRPVTKSELNDRYAKDRRYYLLVRPGVTGLWQVSGRNKLSYSRRVQLDEQYLREWSFWQDISILLRTFDVVFRRDGAC
jgi:undecaprenyl-phosphate galactose phosphotransferase